MTERERLIEKLSDEMDRDNATEFVDRVIQEAIAAKREPEILFMRSASVAELAERLRPIAEAAARPQTDMTITKTSIILSLLMGILSDPVDIEALDHLAITAGLICEHRIGLHKGKQDRS